MCHHNKPDPVGTYLSGICHQLELYFPEVHTSCNSALVHRTLQGYKQIHTIPTSHKWALTIGDLETVINALSSSTNYNNCLFLAQLLTGFFTLFRLGEMTYPNDPKLQDPRKVTKRISVHINKSSYKFFLPGHKANRFFKGNTIIIHKNQHKFNPHTHFKTYLRACDDKFPFSSPLWLTSNGSVPTRSFFIWQLQQFFNADTAGQSLRARGATSLAENSIPPSIIQAIGRWASDTFKIYVWKNPVMIQALLFRQTKWLQSTFLHALEAWLCLFFFLQTFPPPHGWRYACITHGQQPFPHITPYGLTPAPLMDTIPAFFHHHTDLYGLACFLPNFSLSTQVNYLHLSPHSSYPLLCKLITPFFLFFQYRTIAIPQVETCQSQQAICDPHLDTWHYF